MTPNFSPPQSGIEYVIFDRTTGRILQRHSQFDVAQNAQVAIPMEALKKRFGQDKHLVSLVTDRNPANLDILEVKIERDTRSQRFAVDVDKRQLVPLPQLTLKPDKAKVNGNGEDRITVAVQAVDAAGKLVKSYDGAVKITTTRGKLSVLGGAVTLSRGSGSVELTAANETVSKVRIGANAVDGSARSGFTVVEFL